MDQNKQVSIREITVWNDKELAALERLMSTLSPGIRFSKDNIRQLLDAPQSHLYGLYENDDLVGTFTIGIYYSPTGSKACLEDVAVLPECQGKGYGKRMMQKVLDLLQEKDIKQLLLTSKPSRIAANKLYTSMGFLRKETNVYVVKLG